jgi:hypothetical protein
LQIVDEAAAERAPAIVYFGPRPRMSGVKSVTEGQQVSVRAQVPNKAEGENWFVELGLQRST